MEYCTNAGACKGKIIYLVFLSAPNAIFINALTNNGDMNQNVTFDLSIFEKILDFSWIEPTIMNIYQVLNEDKVPEYSKRCKFCNYYFNLRNKINE